MIIFYRHGQTIWNIENRWTGSSDISISINSKEKIERSSDLLKELNFKIILCSTMNRCKQTLGILNGALKFDTKIIYLDSLRERCFGELEGKLKKKDDLLFSNQVKHIESTEDFENRIESMLSIISEFDFSDTILIVSHSHIYKYLFMKYLYIYNKYPNTIKNSEFVCIKNEHLFYKI